MVRELSITLLVYSTDKVTIDRYVRDNDPCYIIADCRDEQYIDDLVTNPQMSLGADVQQRGCVNHLSSHHYNLNAQQNMHDDWVLTPA